MNKNPELIPLNDNVVLEPVKKDDKVTKAGIVLPDSAADRKPTVIGKVIAVGDTVEILAEGDYVMFVDYNFEPVKLEDRELLVGPAEKILAIIMNYK